MYTLPSTAIAGSIYYSGYLDTSKDIVISFDYACYGMLPSGAEGFCVFFGDTFNPIVNGGGPGPGLCYATVSGIDITNTISAGLDGLDSGIIGIGFDLTGNYSSNSYFNSGLDNGVVNSITIRSNYGSSSNFITSTPNLNDVAFSKGINLYQQLTASDQIPDYKRVRVRLTDFGQRIVVDIKNINDLNFTNYLDYTFTAYNNSILSSTTLSAFPVSWPTSVRCGLGFASGEMGDTQFKIKGFYINGVTTLSAAFGTYTYDVDTTTLSASQNYSNPAAPYFFRSDVMVIQNTYDGVLNDIYTTSLGAASATLITATPGQNNPGVPYVVGDKYVNITEHS